MSVEVACFTDESSHGLNLEDIIKVPYPISVETKMESLKKEIQQLLPIEVPLAYIQLELLGTQN